MHHPHCCAPLQTTWPWPEPLANVILVTTIFDTQAFRDDDFTTSNLVCPETLRAAASKRKTEYLAGRVCAREALRLATGQPTVPDIGDDRAPVWPAGSVGAITHGAGWAGALAASRGHYHGLGLDVEQRLSDQRAERLVDQILTPEEKARHAAELATGMGHLLTLIFSMKESLFKALYPIVQRRFYFQDAELVSWSKQGQATLRLLTELSPHWPRGRIVHAHFCEMDHRILSLVAIPAQK